MKEAPIIPLQPFKNSRLHFKVKTIQNCSPEPGELNELPHRHNYYEMIWLTNGKGTMFIDMQQYEIKRNLVYCIKPGQSHYFEMDAQADGFAFQFDDSFFNSGEHEFDWSGQSDLLQIYSHCHAVGIEEGIESDMKEFALKMTKEFENGYAFSTQLLRRYFRIFLLYLTRQFEETVLPPSQTRESDLVNSFREMLEKSYREKKMVAEYAQKLLVTPNYLNGIIKKNTGYSAGHHIRQRVVLEAKRLSRYSDAGMKEIAYDLGFSDIGHFSKFFKTVVGTNFSDFRKEGLSMPLFTSWGRA